MSFLLANSSPLIAAAAFLVACGAVCASLHILRAAHAKRLADLDLAGELLKKHFEAAGTVINDPATPGVIREFLALISQALGRREVARRLAELDAGGDRPPPSERMTVLMTKTQEEMRMLHMHRPDLVFDLATAVSAGITAMMLRWPETEQMAMRFSVTSSEPMKAIKEQSSRVLSAAPDLCAEAA